MTAHILYKNIDKQNCATHSSKIIKLIRNKIGFDGLIITDDISMKALKYDICTNAKKALNAGCNLVLYCNGDISECRKLIKNIPFIDRFTEKKTSEFLNFKLILIMESTRNKSLNLDIPNFSGPLELLLDLAKSQKVNLNEISITLLADQFLEFIKNSDNLNLESASEYLLMATWLAYLKSKLLLPEEDDEDFQALEIAEKLKLQLKKLELIRLLSDQLLNKKRIGREIFIMGNEGRHKIYKHTNL